MQEFGIQKFGDQSLIYDLFVKNIACVEHSTD